MSVNNNEASSLVVPSGNGDQLARKRARHGRDNDDDWSNQILGLNQTLGVIQLRNKDSATLEAYQAELSQLLDKIKQVKEENQQNEQNVAAAIENNSDNNEIIVLPIEAFRAVTRSGFVSTNDLARLLLLSCKAFEESMGREYIFQLLLKSRKDYTILFSRIQAVAGDNKAEIFFRKLVHPPVWRRNEPIEWPATIENPNLTVENTTLLLSIWANGTQLMVEQVPSLAVRRLLEGGRAHWISTQQDIPQAVQAALDEEKAIVNQHMKCPDEHFVSKARQNSLQKLFGKQKRLLVAQLQCLRSDTNQVCTMFHSSSLDYKLPGELKFSGFGHPLQLTDKGIRLLAQCTESKSGRIQQVGGIVFSVCFGRPGFIELKANVVGANGQLSNNRFRNGINIFHLLDEAAGWK